MASTPRPWTVNRPGPPRQLDDNLWVVDDTVPGIPGRSFPRAMAIARLADRRLVLFNAIPLDDDGMKALAALGEPAYLVAPSPFHCIDVHAMRKRLGVKVIAPPRAADEVRKRVEVDGGFELLADAHVRLDKLDGTRFDEPILVVTTGARTSLVFCDAVFNITADSIPGFWGWMWKVFGFSGGPRSGPIWLRRAVDDRAALHASLEKLAALPGLCRLVPSHGVPVEQDAAGTLRAVAARLNAR